MLEIRKIYDADGIGSDFDRWQRRYRYFMVLHVGAARDLLGHLGHHAWNGAVETTRLLRGQFDDGGRSCSNGSAPDPVLTTTHPRGNEHCSGRDKWQASSTRFSHT